MQRSGIFELYLPRFYISNLPYYVWPPPRLQLIQLYLATPRHTAPNIISRSFLKVISVLGDPENPTDISKHEVAEAAGSSIQAAVDSGDENSALQIMAQGASTLAQKLNAQGKFDGVVILGGTMGTDAALDICQALPLGVPKYVVSTVSFSPLIEPERLSAISR